MPDTSKLAIILSFNLVILVPAILTAIVFLLHIYLQSYTHLLLVTLLLSKLLSKKLGMDMLILGLYAICFS